MTCRLCFKWSAGTYLLYLQTMPYGYMYIKCATAACGCNGVIISNWRPLLWPRGDLWWWHLYSYTSRKLHSNHICQTDILSIYIHTHIVHTHKHTPALNLNSTWWQHAAQMNLNKEIESGSNLRAGFHMPCIWFTVHPWTLRRDLLQCP